MNSALISRFTVSKYHRMSELGILFHTERTELLNGEIFQLIDKSTAHAAARRTGDVFLLGLKGEYAVHIKAPISLDEQSEPYPDVTVTVTDPEDFITHHSGPDEILLLIEVADSSLKHDLETKAAAYAIAGIVEYWVLDVDNRRLFVFHQPTASGYQTTKTYTDVDAIAPLFFKDFEIHIADMLPPVIPQVATEM
ncbi:MAG: Uma2 family endonuclease [Cyanobacteria bacterium J06626_23]